MIKELGSVSLRIVYDNTDLASLFLIVIVFLLLTGVFHGSLSSVLFTTFIKGLVLFLVIKFGLAGYQVAHTVAHLGELRCCQAGNKAFFVC